ncbi:PhzF family phenazine biosynthesis protein [uncultured Paludibaculum sp.]|uniref:PhzF family phenazine biosynthesis protein n=1 Tax=uncultured Paludibaculum sp. TaxID=1765020 RepID=UPI002AAC39AD|nr:PhzF family phenazine biosynthesis protein [uncultured Paludibaculum sp.]
MLSRREFHTLSALTSMSANAPVRTFAFEWWDVFTTQPLSGNQLAVFPDARGLSDAEMQRIAREMNLSETTFVLPRDQATETKQGVKVRIFTREQEIPFGGHPALGTACLLRDRVGDNVKLDLGVGPVPVTFTRQPDGRVFGDMLQAEPVFAETHQPARIAPLLGLHVEDLDTSLPIQNVSTGRPNLLVMLRSLDAIRRLKVNWNDARAYFAEGDKQRGFYVMTREVETPGAFLHARKPSAAQEDPATGSAAGCAIAWLVLHGLVESGTRIRFEQGIEMKRPGELHVSAVKSGNRIHEVRVGGYCVRVMQGTLAM